MGNVEPIFGLGAKNEDYKKYFIGDSYVNMLVADEDINVGVANVTFEPKCRNDWHIHHNGYQILLVTDGEGWYQEEGKDAIKLKKGVLYGIGAALPYMTEKNSGQFINISSVAGHFAHAGGAVYSASKWAVRAISESLREEMALSNLDIRVTVISPGAINTELVASVTEEEVRASMEDFYDKFAISAERVALTIKQAIDLPKDAAWNEVIIRPTRQVV